MVVCLGIVTHMVLDTLAGLVVYHFGWLAVVSVLVFTLSCGMVAHFVDNKSLVKQVIVFMLVALLVCHSELLITYYGFGVIPQQTMWFWLIPPMLALCFAVIFWGLFKHHHPRAGGGAAPSR